MEFSYGSSYPVSMLALLQSDPAAQQFFSQLPPWAQLQAKASNFATAQELYAFGDSLRKQGKL